jgi:WD repeat-containing protein 55
MENDHVVATGDDNGLIKIWDLRQAQAGVKKSCAMELNEHEQSITGLNYVQDKNMLLSVANDGMLGVWDLRTGKLHAMSDSLEEDLSAVCLMRDGKKVITSTSEGIITFSHGTGLVTATIALLVIPMQLKLWSSMTRI